MRTKRYIGGMMMTAALAAVVSCSDYSDWNTVPGDGGSPTANTTLLKNLESHPELSDFMQVLRRADVANLNTTRFYTVWAPVNGSFNLDSVLECKDEAILAQFINNHIAEYNHQAAAFLADAERVKTLNKKTYNFQLNPDGTYTYNDVPLATDAEGNPLFNIPCSNGTLHMIEGNSDFLPNGFEALSMLKEELAGSESAVDQIADYIFQYNDTALDTKNSVPGSIVNGKQTYLDSVFTVSNVILSRNRANARIDDEDSTYSVLLPNDKAYDDYYKTVKSFYKFLDGFKWQNVRDAASTTYQELTIDSKTIGTDMAYLSDSLAKRAIISNLFYSNNHPYNMHLVKEDAFNYNDTVVTTLRAKYSNGDELFDPAHTLKKQHLSNGFAYVVDTLPFKPWEAYNPPITINGTNYCRSIANQSISNVRLSEENTNTDLVDISDGNTVSYCWAMASARTKPEVDFYLNNARSTTYNIYCVIPPANVDKRDEVSIVQPNILNFNYQGYYTDAKGKVAYGTVAFTNERYETELAELVDGQLQGKRIEGVAATAKKTTANTYQPIDFVNDTSKVDTMFLGQITIPYSYAGLGYAPNIKVTSSSRINTLSNPIMKSYTRDVRICAILLRPLDYEKYLKEEEKKNPKLDE